MQSMSLAESAILLGLHPVGMGLLILCRIVVTLLAFRTSQCDPCAHLATSSILRSVTILSIKKRPKTHLAHTIYHRATGKSTVFP